MYPAQFGEAQLYPALVIGAALVINLLDKFTGNVDIKEIANQTDDTRTYTKSLQFGESQHYPLCVIGESQRYPTWSLQL